MKIVICGSMSASKRMVEVKDSLEKIGHTVVLPRNTENYAFGIKQAEDKHESTRNKIDHNLVRKYYLYIKDSDAVLVVNCDKGNIKDYIGGNSFLEAGFAHVLNKKLYFLNDIPDMIYSDELKALQPIILKGDLSKVR